MFYSSATVYGDSQRLPLTEEHPLSATNPCGQTTLLIEKCCSDLYRSDPSWRISIMRYFNLVDAHASGLIARTRRAFPTTCCLLWHRWPWGSANF